MDARGSSKPAAEAAETLGLPAFLGCLQLADASFPAGRYALSYGLESFVRSGRITTASGAAGLAALLGDQLEHGVGPADGVAMAWAHRGNGSDLPSESVGDLSVVVEADRLLTAVKLTRESRETSARVGRQLLATAAAAFDAPAVTAYADGVRGRRFPGNAAVVMGLLTAQLAVPLVHAVTTELYAFAAGWLNAAIRLGVTDHRVAQAVLHRSTPVLARACRAACEAPLQEMRSCLPLVDIMGMHHEQAALRLFMS